MKIILLILCCMAVYSQTFAQRKIMKEVHNQVVRDQLLDFVLWLDSNQYDSGKLYMDHSNSGKASLRYWRTSDTTLAYITRKEKGILNLHTGQAYDLRGEHLYGNHSARLRNYREKQVRIEDDFGIYETAQGKTFQSYKDYLPKQITPYKTAAYLVKHNRFVDVNGVYYDNYDTVTTLRTYDDQKRLITEEKKFSFDSSFYRYRIEYVNDTVVETLSAKKTRVHTGGGVAVSKNPYHVIKTHILKDTLGEDIRTRKYTFRSDDAHFSEDIENTTIRRGDDQLVYIYEKTSKNKYFIDTYDRLSGTKVVYRWKKWGPKR